MVPRQPEQTISITNGPPTFANPIRSNVKQQFQLSMSAGVLPFLRAIDFTKNDFKVNHFIRNKMFGSRFR